MTEPLQPYPDRRPAETGGILGALDAVGHLGSFIAEQRGMPMPHSIRCQVYLPVQQFPDFAQRRQLIKLLADAHGVEVQTGRLAIWIEVPIPTPTPGPLLIYTVTAPTVEGVREHLS